MNTPVAAPIYLDNHATTRVDPRVVERMLPFFAESYGNPTSRSHVFGWRAEEAVEAARTLVAQMLGATAREVLFTSGATESNNLALQGVARAYASKGRHFVTQATEHPSVLDTLTALEEQGARVTRLPVDREGRVTASQVREALTPDTVLVSIMLANNEVGTVQPLAEIGEVCRAAGVLLHCDAAQGAGKIPIDVEALRCDLLSISGHKFYAPKGVGALYVRRREPRVQLLPLVFGGGQERGLRSGTLNVPGIVGLGEASRLVCDELAREGPRIRELRDRAQRVLEAAGGRVTAPTAERLPGNLHLTFAGTSAEDLMLAVPELAFSSGAACASASRRMSPVLAAMGLTHAEAHGSIRLGLGRFTTQAEVDYAAGRIAYAVRALAKDAPSPLFE